MLKFYLSWKNGKIQFGCASILIVAMALAGCGGGSGGSGGSNSGNSGGTPASYLVTYSGNGQDAGSVPVDDNDYEEGQTVTVQGNTGNLVKAGYLFDGWNTQADGGGTSYLQGAEFEMGAADVMLYAEWAAEPWPAAWQHQDIGSGMLAGSAGYDGGTFTITAAGEYVWPSTSDQMHFVYQVVSGNFTLVARVASMQKNDLAALAGLMVRGSLSADSRNVQFFVAPDLGYVGARLTDGAEFTSGAENLPGDDVPVYLKLQRAGNDFTAAYSSDGIDWTPSHYSRSVAMDDPVYVGMFVMSYYADILETATFDHVSIE